ncbi:helix-turn-helix domain-containing protein [Mameliella sp. CS4]|nr:helix-turn-helix domain-containing protein [Mameliella sp. CS4]
MDETPADSPVHPVLAVAPAEGARISGVGRTKFYQAISSGDLKSFKFGSRRLVRVAEIEAWLKRLEAAASGETER